jgi:hypothetical protein
MGSEITTTRKIKVYRNSVGNKFFFNQIPRTKKKVIFPKQSNQEDILKCLQRNKNCCSAGRYYMGCLGYKFIDRKSSNDDADIQELIKYVQECRNITRTKSDLELRQFVKEVYDKAEISKSDQKTLMDYRLPVSISTRHITVSNNKVCRKGRQLNNFSSTNARIIHILLRHRCCLWILCQGPSNLF